MGKFFNFRLFVLMTVFGVGGGLYSSFVPLLFRHMNFEVMWMWSYFSWFVSLGFMFLIVFVMWWVGRGLSLRKELVSTGVSLFLGAWFGRFFGTTCGQIVWFGRTNWLLFLENILFSAFSGLSLFFEGFTGVAIGYLTGREVEKSV